MEMIKETAKVVRQQQIDEGIFDMELSFPKGAALAKPGQFIAMYCNDKSKLLPRPISICGINKEEGTLRVVYRVAGEGTKEFSEMKEGDTLEVMGPLGNGFALKEEKAIIIGGGIGIPPMLELAKQLNVEKTVVLGYRTSTFLKDEFEAVCDVKVSMSVSEARMWLLTFCSTASLKSCRPMRSANTPSVPSSICFKARGRYAPASSVCRKPA